MALLAPSTSTHPYTASRRRIFNSVFPPTSLPPSLPSPPPAPATPTHTYNTRQHHLPSPSPALSLLPPAADVLVRKSHAWRIATEFLSFGKEPFPKTMKEWLKKKRPASRDVLEAVRYLCHGNEDGRGDGREELEAWYWGEVERHFWGIERRRLEVPEVFEDPAATLDELLQIATTAQEIYLYPMQNYILLPMDTHSITTRSASRRKRRNEGVDTDPRLKSFTRSLNAFISAALPDPAWSDLVYGVFMGLCSVVVGLPDSIEGMEDEMDEDSEVEVKDEEGESDDELYDTMPSVSQRTDLDGDIIVTTDEGSPIQPEDFDGMEDFREFQRVVKGPRAEARRKVLLLWESMEKLGIGGGGRRGERVFAEVVNALLTKYIQESFANRWDHPGNAQQELEDWVEGTLRKLILDVLFSGAKKKTGGEVPWDKLSPRESLRASRQSLDNRRRRGGMDIDAGAGAEEEEEKKRRLEDLESWKKIAVGRLGRLRVSELFDIVVDWPASLGGIEDLKSYITTPQTRLHLVTTFTAALNLRLLHPGAATADLLSAYIRLIRAFTVLDPRGVLLDRVSRSIRRYLRERDDTIRVVVRGMMSESASPDPTDPDSDLAELAAELTKGLPQQTFGGLEELDYDDMNWIPDPIDAGPEFKRSKGLDVVGSLISLWENKEVWLKEVQNVLAGRLLDNSTYDTTNEVRTIELLKLRFGDGPTQACDVMLKDMYDSKRVDADIIGDLQAFSTEFHAKVLSRMYWPSNAMKADTTFRLPPKIIRAMDQYQRAYEGKKKKRQLDWLTAVATVELELELEDRTVLVPDATAAQAAVIHMFDDVASWKGSELMEQLEMEKSIFNPAISFWLDKDVLRETEAGVYTVRERLDDDDGAKVIRTGGMEPGEEEEVDPEKEAEKKLVEQFVVGMLTNSGVMGEEAMHMMLSMVVPGGFRWTLEELREFLRWLKEEGRVEVAPGGWKVVRQ